MGAEAALHVEVEDGANRARLSGELDLSGYEAATATLAPLFDASGDVVLDVANLTFVDSSGIRLFIRLRDALGDRGRLILASPQPHVERVLKIAGLDKLGVELGDESVA
jgi:anti-sigma B factor antagonist